MTKDHMPGELAKFMADPSEGGTRQPTGFTKQECFEAGFRACQRIMFAEQQAMAADVSEIVRLQDRKSTMFYTERRLMAPILKRWNWIRLRLTSKDLYFMATRKAADDQMTTDMEAYLDKLCN